MKLIKIKLKDRLKERNMEQKELAKLTGLSTRTISELVNDKTSRIPRNALERIAEVLNIDDMNALMEIREVNEESKD